MTGQTQLVEITFADNQRYLTGNEAYLEELILSTILGRSFY
jgi:hypothetical protein